MGNSNLLPGSHFNQKASSLTTSESKINDSISFANFIAASSKAHKDKEGASANKHNTSSMLAKNSMSLPTAAE